MVTAAVMAFGLVCAHPFTDGNGRIHRWLVHHVLAKAGYNPPGLFFPVSAAILRRLDEHRSVLLRFFDATAQAEFLYTCVEQTVEVNLPGEVKFLQAFDRFAAAVKEIVEMPDAQIELLRGFLEQGGGNFSKRAREGEFSAITGAEAARIEELYVRSFGE